MSSASLEKVLNCPSLPSLPTVAIELLELTRRPNVKFSEIEQIVQNDPALAGKILKTVNSSYYALAKPCPTIGRAMKYLGINTVKSLVLGFSLVDATSGGDGRFNLAEYWRRCLFCAAAARRIATMTGGCDRDEAFIAALMQDIGMLAMDRALGDEYHAVVGTAGGDHERLAATEQTQLGFDHAEAGGSLAERWRLPAQLVGAIRDHHASGVIEDPLVRIIVLAGLLYAATHGAEVDRETRDRIAETLRLSETSLEEICTATMDDAKELADQFTIKLNDSPSSSAIMAQAEDQLLAHQVKMQRDAEELALRNQQLSEQAFTDGLTGVGNRKKFDEELATRFQQARDFNGEIGMILADADKFKVLNDTYGHQVGDLVLVELARRLTVGAGERGLVCRYGGEEFAVIATGANRQQTAEIAEALRLLIEAAPIDLTSMGGAVKEVAVTASFGAAVMDPATVSIIRTPEILIRAADKALYAAKEGGRNCVRVFKPRAPAAA